MMNLLEEAIIYATIMHQGKVRKVKEIPYILHPIEVAQIISTMTDDQEVITAGILHDIVGGTDGTLSEITNRFGKRVAELVEAESQTSFAVEGNSMTWRERKEEYLRILKNSSDIGLKMLCLADTLANLRSLAGSYSEQGDKLWDSFNEKNPQEQRWYYQKVAEYIEISLNKTGAFKELIKHINFIWPGTYDSEKTRFKKYKEVSIEGCKKIGSGAKGDVYKYDDELIIKVYNDKNTYKDVEREIALAKKAFVMGIPTAISFGVVSVGKRYGSMFELLDCSVISDYIANHPGEVEYYARQMADLGRTIHGTVIDEDENFPSSASTIGDWVHEGLEKSDPELAKRFMTLVDALPPTRHVIHGDFHTGNVFLQRDEPMLIDMDRLAMGHPIIDLCGLYMAYIGFGEVDPSKVEKYMGFSYDIAKKFYWYFLQYYLDTRDEERIRQVSDKAALVCYMRMIRRPYRKRRMGEKDFKEVERLTKKTAEYLDKVDSLLI